MKRNNQLLKTKGNISGLTLIELLVTLVILSFTIALFSGALGQISQIIRISSEQNNGFLSRWNNTRSLHEIISNMVIDPTLDIPFSGEIQKIRLVSIVAPEMPRGFPYIIQVDIKKNDNSSEIQAIINKNLNSEKIKKIATYPHSIEFRFIDHQGNENKSWPPNSLNEYRPMPSSITLVDSENNKEIIKFANYDGEWYPPSSGMQDFLGPGK